MKPSTSTCRLYWFIHKRPYRSYRTKLLEIMGTLNRVAGYKTITKKKSIAFLNTDRYIEK